MRSVWPESFTLSAILHALVVGGVLVYALFVAPRQEATPQIFEMVAPPPPGDASTPANEASTEEVRFQRPRVPLYDYGRLPTPVSTPQPVVDNPPPDALVRPANREPKRTTPPQAPPSPTRMSYEEFQRQNRRSTQPPSPVTPPRLTPPPPVASGSPGGELGSSGMTELEGYYQRMQAALKAAWERPEGLSSQLEAVVEFDISETGVLSGARIVRSSGNTQFDQSVLRVFERVRTFAPPPGRQALRGNRQPFRLADG